jgi:hypothetical protein
VAGNSAWPSYAATRVGKRIKDFRKCNACGPPTSTHAQWRVEIVTPGGIVRGKGPNRSKQAGNRKPSSDAWPLRCLRRWHVQSPLPRPLNDNSSADCQPLRPCRSSGSTRLVTTCASWPSAGASAARRWPSICAEVASRRGGKGSVRTRRRRQLTSTPAVGRWPESGSTSDATTVSCCEP